MLIVSIADGRINILREKKLLAETFDSNPFEIGHISFGSFDNAIIQYYYNCENSIARAKRQNLTDSTKLTKTVTTEMTKTDALIMMKSSANGYCNNTVSLLVMLLMLRILLHYFLIQFHLI